MSTYLLFDCESIPDGALVRSVKYPDEPLEDIAAIEKAQRETLEASGGRSDFLAVTFQIPVAISIGLVSDEYRLERIVALGRPDYQPGEITRQFWAGIRKHVYAKDPSERARVVSFNGRSFDFPLMEMAAFRYGIEVPGHFTGRYGLRDRYATAHLDLMEFFTNYSSLRYFTGGLNLLAKLLGKPGKMSTTGHDVFRMHQEGKFQEISDYCSFDVLDTYFVFLRSQVMAGLLPLDIEQERVAETKRNLEAWSEEEPHYRQYLEHWGDWAPRP